MKIPTKKLQKSYESDASQIQGQAKEVYLPENLQELKAEVLKNKKVCIRGGGTGLAGGAVPSKEEVLIDLSKLSKIENLDLDKKTIEIEAGLILDDLNDYLEKYNLEFPVKPSSHAVCTIGGMIATNAVGSRAIKYGKTSNWIKWIEIINCEGKIERKGATEISDYSGMEGITGVIYKACLKLSEKVNRTATVIARESIDEIMEQAKSLKRNPEVSMIEFIDKNISQWLGLKGGHHLIVEFESGNGDFSGENYEELMQMRDKIYPLLSNKGYTHIEDPQIIVDRIGTIIKNLEAKKIPVFGHLSVGVIHPCFKQDQKKYIPELIKAVKRLGGKVTGEHGIGLTKKEFVEFNDKKIWGNIKKRCDPKNKFNCGKVI